MTPAAAILVGTAVAAAAFVQGTLGVGFALVIAPLLGIVAPALLPGALLLLMLPLNAWVAYRERSALDWPGVRQITFGRVAGGILGLVVLVTLPDRGLQLFVGVATIAAALASLLAPDFSPGRRAYLAAGAATGVTETATGIGGPPLALVYQHRPAAVLRATVALCFLVGEVLSLLLLLAAGRLDGPQVRAAVLLAPPLALGVIASGFAGSLVDGPVLRRLILAFAIVSGIVCLMPPGFLRSTP
ncbi:sulfite exporter TauE/SafE family protein [Methylobacterium nonmethylotrophicum]|uniref:Probable membrane transporter protein n=1 Tax=Methylobacterium nonmethylotrophicum TaxID=1141884 RepID=A0A4Z0NGZ3_9HYPH|nr:sulfite exporter TauE/SafE family protein [Methylobacterium nonmethylotrophicum]TGD94922.1 sulfite exporter TauE/SafE family protein [Methylobacterium nonmethylotrophicum]